MQAYQTLQQTSACFWCHMCAPDRDGLAYLCVFPHFSVCWCLVCLPGRRVRAAQAELARHTSVAMCSNLRSQLGTLVIIQTLPFAPTLKAFIWLTWNSREPDKASNAACRPKRSGKGEEMHGGIDGIVLFFFLEVCLHTGILSSLPKLHRKMCNRWKINNLGET